MSNNHNASPQDEIINLQEKIFDICESSYDETEEYILNSIFIENKDSLIQLCLTLKEAINTRPFLFDYYINIFTAISSILTKFLTQKEILKIFVADYLILKFYNIGIITIDTIIDISNTHQSSAIFFAPELLENDPNYFKTYKNHENSEENITESIGENIEEKRKLRDAGINSSPLAVAIRNDDVETFQELISAKNIQLNSHIEYSTYEQCKIISQKPTICEFTAFLGSTKIFKFLIMNQVSLNSRVARFAVAGGNYEIIHILEAENCSFYGSLDMAISFHRNEIFEYILESKNFEITYEILKVAIENYNMEIFYKYILQFLESDPYRIFSDILPTAAFYGILDIIKYICSLEQFEENTKLYIFNICFIQRFYFFRF
ncbi:hypothetical protein TRFO_13740 [Tritrichomonas foetus]|uniref:DUF3447 domain-containing protein n=1 Tax=Tritrichomonas foetus TaxID=1144522 RepID=A0A1J4L1P9_9EUKA|nr:hypothetical protein TRFO_13740 [Tritrichomonas foetus]|eukprot:OHT15892.1 hypothetical protein TRFO_13740 [Tritrichomonas foetus]